MESKERIKVKKKEKRKQDPDCLWDQIPVGSLGALAHQGLSLPLKDTNKHWHHFSQLRMTLSLNMPARENPGPP